MSKIINAVEEKADPDLSHIEKTVESEQEQDADYWASKSKEEAKLVRKMDKRILPIACLMYLFACLFIIPLYSPKPINIADLDRTNLGNARLQGLPQDALGGDKTGKLFDWVNSAYVTNSS